MGEDVGMSHTGMPGAGEGLVSCEHITEAPWFSLAAKADVTVTGSGHLRGGGRRRGD